MNEVVSRATLGFETIAIRIFGPTSVMSMKEDPVEIESFTEETIACGFSVDGAIGSGSVNRRVVLRRSDQLVAITADRGEWKIELGLEGLPRLYGTQEWRAYFENTRLPVENDRLDAQLEFARQRWLPINARFPTDLESVRLTMRANNSELMLRKYGRSVDVD